MNALNQEDKEAIGNPSESAIVKTVKEQGKKITKLEKKIIELEQTIIRLRGLITSLEAQLNARRKKEFPPKDYPIIKWEKSIPDKSTWYAESKKGLK